MYGHQYTDAERAFILANVSRGRAWIAEQLGLPFTTIDGYFSRNKLRTGVNTQFKKGEQRGHRFQKGQCISPATQFKKGIVPQNTAPEGDRTVRIRKDKRGVASHFIRVQKRVWVPLSRYVWETFFGAIPPGMIVVFQDENTLNPHPDNLALLSRAEHAQLNSNPKKAAETIKDGRAAGSYYASQLFRKNKPLRQFALDHAPDLVEAKRQQLKLKNQLKTSHEPRT